MILADYLARHPHLTLEAFGAQVGASGATVSRWLAKKARPSWRRLARIEQVTGGQVTAADFYPELAPLPPQQPMPCRRRPCFARAVAAARAAAKLAGA